VEEQFVEVNIFGPPYGT